MSLRELLIYISTYIGLFAVTFYVLSLKGRKETHPEFPKTKPPMVSILVPAFNEEKGIEGTIKSILEIDYPKDKLEIIVVDDGSRDNTYQNALKYKGKRVKVFRQEKNQGKFAALNFAIEKAKGEFIVTTDADNLLVKKDALKNMIAYFDNPKVMCVAPMMAIYKPKGILQRVQQIEYLLGVFLRKAFSNVNAIHITPGAFSAYRKSFFKKYGGFKRAHLTEDMEMALRIQSHHYIIENSLKATVLTVAPNKFIPLLKQRRRWYTGLIRNLWDYRRLISRKYGVMGLIVIPTAITTVIMSVILTFYMTTTTLLRLKKELLLLNSINFDFFNSFEISRFAIERFLFLVFSQPIFIFTFVFLSILVGYMLFAKSKIKQDMGIRLSLVWFFFFYAFLFAFWWTISFVYAIFNRKVTWR